MKHCTKRWQDGEERKSRMAELKPCPFCGGRAEISQGRYDGKDTSYVMCKECMAQGEFFIVSTKYASDEKAIKAWNRRAGAGWTGLTN